MSKSSGRGAGGLLIVALIGVVGLGASLFLGEATLTHYASDWINWARLSPVYAAAAGFSVLLVLIGVIGALLRSLDKGSSHDVEDDVYAGPAPVAPAERLASEGFVLHAAPAARDPLSVPDGQDVEDWRSGHTFASSVSGDAGEIREVRTAETAPRPVEVSLFGDQTSLEPRIFHDNASDSFLSHTPAVDVSMPEAAVPAPSASFDVPSHTEVPTAEIIPLRPSAPEVPVVPVNDPVGAALLAETPEVQAHLAPQGDINAVITSAMRFIETPSAATAPEPVADEAHDDEAEIAHAVQTALSVWPDATRAIAAEEIKVRVATIYYNKAAATQKAFHQIASGELSGAASTLSGYADALAQGGGLKEAAELWRVIGALYMGRDDGRALNAYERVSELDADDANIHLYLSRRFLLSGEAAKLPPVAERALRVIGDPAIRVELLTPYADQLLKGGDVARAAGALEELLQHKEQAALAHPDDVSARSAYAISLARLAQTREMLGAATTAAPLYRKAHQVFADLSVRMPDHAGLRAMAENALRDANRLSA